jgi:ribosomal protein S18 acetylase RimI-like enzyme
MTDTIRAYRPDDYDWVLQALAQLQAHEHALHDSRLPAETATTKLYLDEMLARLAENDGALLIAERDGVAVGLVGGHTVHVPWPLETADSNFHAYISDIFIDPEHRRTGLAAELLDAIAAHFRALPLPLRRLRLNTLAANGIARAAYEKAGFRSYEVIYERPL